MRFDEIEYEIENYGKTRPCRLDESKENLIIGKGKVCWQRNHEEERKATQLKIGG